MSCFSPVSVWRDPLEGPPSPPDLTRINLDTGELLPGPRPGISFTHRSGWERLAVGCGRCDGCRADRALEWSIRCYHEASLYPRNSFLTLTYDSAPPALVKSDLQKFFKRLRHSYTFRYFACGEYGEKTRRPHYHALIFGEDFLSGNVTHISDELYTNEAVAKCWGHGLVSIAELNMATCCYVAGYVFKKIGDHETFSVQSRRPGIGHDWLDRFSGDLTRTGSVTIEGREYPIPRRYMKWDDFKFHEEKLRRAALQQERAPKTISEEREQSRHLKAKAAKKAASKTLGSKTL